MKQRGRILRKYETSAVFENLETGNCLLATQVLQKNSCSREFRVCERENLPDLGSCSDIIPLEALFGIYDLLSGPYAAILIESDLTIGDIPNCNFNMRRAKKIIVVPLFRSGFVLSETKQNDEDRYLQLLHIAFAQHTFYYSPSYDITFTQQRLAQLSQRQITDPIWTRADHRFFWNREIVVDLISCEANQWIVPFMSAFVECRRDLVLEDTNGMLAKFTLLFISRRSRYRQGCRFTRRGLDESGNAANFVETEQILIFPDGGVSSYVQVRGSIPVKWNSPVLMKYDPNVYIDEQSSKSEEWCEKHVADLTDRYSDNQGVSSVIFINLVDKKKDQQRLGVEFQKVVQKVEKKTKHKLLYEWFDFHHETKKKGKWNNLKLLIQPEKEKEATPLYQLFIKQNFFLKTSKGEVKSCQAGVIRTNCMDNLDRTNVVQSLFARRSFILQLIAVTQQQQNSETKLKAFTDALAGDVLNTPWKSFEKTYKDVWGNNADAMSFAYAGTGALKTDFTRTGKRTYKGAFNDGVNSCMRYYINNFTDGVKQDSIDLLLGTYRVDPSKGSPFKPRPEQESLPDNLTKAFVLVMIIFSTLLLLAPVLTSVTHDDEKTCQSGVLPGLSMCIPGFGKGLNLLVAVIVSAVIVFYVMFLVVKKGSKIGERVVVHPQLICEPVTLLPSSKSSRK